MSLETIAYNLFERPYILILTIPIIIALVYYINKGLIKIQPEDKEYKNRIKKRRLIILASRIIIVLLLIIALASPYTEKSKLVQGDPKVKILVDNSTSMSLFDTSRAESLKKELENRIPTEFEYTSRGEETAIGDSILAGIRRNDNILLFTDGQNNKGAELGDVALYSRSYNSTISAIELKPKYYDASVSIIGSDKTITNAENTFTVKVQQTEKRSVLLVVEADGNKIIEKQTEDEEIQFTRAFEKGQHRITARILQDDYFKQNNEFYKTIKVVPKPKVAMYGGNQDLFQLLEPLYELKVLSDLGEEMKENSGIIIDNKPSSELNDKTILLGSYIAEGNGMLVIGGDKSYETGGYKDSRFEQLLPVFVSKPGRKKGEINVVFVIDVSGSTGHYFGDDLKVDVEKTLALSMIKDLSLTNYLGVVAFNNKAYTIAEVGLLSQQRDLEDKISRLKYGDNTYIEEGILMAVEMLQGRGGSKNIILISDGKTQHMDESENAFKIAASKGIRIYTVGVGDDTYAEFLQYAADLTGGIYFEPEESQGIKLLFGETEASGGKKVFPLYIVDKNHFITEGLKITANLYGFNQVAPKTSSKLLMTTDVGDPILTTSRYGLGRVASLSTDYGTYGFELLNKQNSALFTRTINWIIGDPERKNEEFIDIKDSRVEEEAEILVKSKDQPRSEEVALYKIDENLYKGALKVEKTGFHNMMSSIFAVNYKKEYQDIGFNDNMNRIILATNGKMFRDDEAEQIVEFIKTRSKREIITKRSYSWIFITLALLVFLAEVSYRRIARNKN
ncbi:MAG TPA: vWA domain-containing protein [Candidatus Nanoarchaeia archaeon]|nr:vWA domain-containing protein [Candidatus Nanoarchaeia archaeon]